MRILQVHTSYRQSGGEDTVVEAEAELLRSAGHAVHRHEASNPSGRLATGASLALSAWNPVAAAGVRTVVQRFKPDVAHVHNTWFTLSPSVVEALDRLGVPVVATAHNYRTVCANAQLLRAGRPCEDCVGRVPWRAVPHRCYRSSMLASAAAATTIALQQRAGTWSTRVAVWLVLSRFAAVRLTAGTLPADRTRVHPNFVADPGPRAVKPSASDLVLFVGRLAPEKGVEMAIEAWRQASPRGLKLVIAGEGPLRSQLARRLPPGVTLVGQLDPSEVADLMARSRALLFPSRWYEGQPLVILEAMASGLPILASDLGAMPELVGSDGWGVCLPPTDIAAWAGALSNLTDGAGLDAASRCGRARYQFCHTPAHALESLEAAYQCARASADEEVPA